MKTSCTFSADRSTSPTPAHTAHFEGNLAAVLQTTLRPKKRPGTVEGQYGSGDRGQLAPLGVENLNASAARQMTPRKAGRLPQKKQAHYRACNVVGS
jgi:hypothetical protein